MPVEIDIAHVAHLARIALTDEELAAYAAQLENILEHAERALAIRPAWLQLRAKTCDDQTWIELASALRERCTRTATPFVINDRADIAKIVEADGLHLGQDDLGFARLDTDRERRTGVAEVIFGPGKTDHQLATLVRHSLELNDSVLVTRLEAERPCLFPTGASGKLMVQDLAEQAHQTVSLAVPERLVPGRYRARAHQEGRVRWAWIKRTLTRLPTRDVLAVVVRSLEGRDVILFLESLEVPPTQAAKWGPRATSITGTHRFRSK